MRRPVKRNTTRFLCWKCVSLGLFKNVVGESYLSCTISASTRIGIGQRVRIEKSQRGNYISGGERVVQLDRISLPGAGFLKRSSSTQSLLVVEPAETRSEIEGLAASFRKEASNAKSMPMVSSDGALKARLRKPRADSGIAIKRTARDRLVQLPGY